MPTWNDNLETGHALIDADHRELFHQLNALKTSVQQGAGRERIVELIVVLQHYVLGHFAREEVHMARIACPAMQANCAAHREFALKLDRWLELLTMPGTPVSLLLDVHRESIAWIEQHITHVDCRMRGCTPRTSAP